MSSLSEQIGKVGLVEPAGIFARVVQRHLQRASEAAEEAFEELCARPAREELKAGFVEGLRERLQAGAGDALGVFDAATGKVSSDARPKARAELERSLGRGISDLQGVNEEHRREEESAAGKAANELKYNK